MACQAVEVQMTTKTDSLNSRISSSYKQLTQAATELNAVSDELGKFVTALDAALRRLNLGIATWLRLESREDSSGNYTKRDLGYAKVGNKWGIALRTMTGNHNDVEDSNVEEWLFNDAPRALRIESVEKLPDLFENLVKEADAATKQIRTKTERAQALASALTEQAAAAIVTEPTPPPKKSQGTFPMMKSKF
jgi:chaperonin cofactor prefoldin